MADLSNIEQKLNSDPKLKQQFLHDPVGVLKAEGVHLSPHLEQQIKSEVAKATGPQAAAPGATASRVEVSIGITIRF